MNLVIERITFEELCPGVILDVSSIPMEYGEEYAEKYARYSRTEMGKSLSKFRKNFVEMFRPERVLDYGCGWGTLVLSQNGWSGYDINPFCMKHLGEKAVRNPVLQSYDCVCFFDSFEHLSDPTSILKSMSADSLLVCTIPIWCKNSWSGIVSWKHWRPSEHLCYFTLKGLISYLEMYGFSVLRCDPAETEIGREDMVTFCFKKNG